MLMTEPRQSYSGLSPEQGKGSDPQKQSHTFLFVWLAFGLVALLVACGIGAFAIQQIAANLPAATTAPTIQPTLAPAAQRAGVVIVLAPITVAGRSSDGAQMQHALQAAIQQELTTAEFSERKPRIELVSDTLRLDDYATADRLGGQYNAKVVVWGEVIDGRLTLNMLSRRLLLSGAEPPARFPAEQLPYRVSHFVADDTSAQLRFFALLALGHSFIVHDEDALLATQVMSHAVELLTPDDHLVEGETSAYIWQGYAHMNGRNWAGAQASFDQALVLSPDDIRALEGRAYVEFKQDDITASKTDVERAIKLDANFAELFLHRGLVRSSQDDVGGALNDYNQALKLNPALSDTYFARGYLYSQQDNLTAAIKDYTTYIANQPDDAWGYFYRALDYHYNGDLDEALADYTKALDLHIDEPARAYYGRGGVYYRKKNYSAAISDYSLAIQFDPDDTAAYFNRGLAHNHLDHYDEAWDDFTKALELEIDPDYVSGAHYGRGIARSGQERWQEALDEFDQSIALNPDDPDGYYERGLMLRNLDKNEQALAALNEAIKRRKDDMDYYYVRGLIHRDLDLNHEATADLKRALELASTQDQRDSIQDELDQLTDY